MDEHQAFGNPSHDTDRLDTGSLYTGLETQGSLAKFFYAS